MPHLHLIHVARTQVGSTCIHLYRLLPSMHVSRIGDKTVVMAICIHLYPLVSGYKLLVRDTCIRLHVSDVNAALSYDDGTFLMITYEKTNDLVLNVQ